MVLLILYVYTYSVSNLHWFIRLLPPCILMGKNYFANYFDFNLFIFLHTSCMQPNKSNVGCSLNMYILWWQDDLARLAKGLCFPQVKCCYVFWLGLGMCSLIPSCRQWSKLSIADVFWLGLRLRSYHSGSSLCFDDLEIDLQDKLESVFDFGFWFNFELVPYVEQYENITTSLRGLISLLTGSGYALKPITPLLIIFKARASSQTGYRNSVNPQRIALLPNRLP